MVKPSRSAWTETFGLFEQYMDRALDQARAAMARGEVPVGAVLVLPGGRTYVAANAMERTRSSLAHAELQVIQRALAAECTRWLEDAALFVTLEPCPMCAGAVLLARIPLVVFALRDPRMGALGSVMDLFAPSALPHRPLVVSGVRAGAAETLLREFFARRRRPSRSSADAD